MSFKVFVFCVTLAIARAGYLQPELRYAHAAPVHFPAPAPLAIAAPAPLAIAAPAPLTYAIPPTVRAEPLPPVVTTSYGYSSAHTPVPAPIIRAAPVHVAPAPLAFAAPAIHAAPLARVGLSAPAFHAAPLARVGLPAPAQFVAPALPAPAHFVGPALSAPAAVGFAGHLGGANLAFGRSYATGFGFGHGPAINPAPFATFGGHFARGIAAPAPFAVGHSSYGGQF